MNFEPTEIQTLLQDSAQAYATARRRRVGASPAQRHTDDWQTLVDMGWLALALPEAQGGMDGGAVEAMLIMQALGHCHSREPYATTALIGARALSRWGSDSQREQWLPQLLAGHLRMAWMNGETWANSVTPRASVVARGAAAGYVLSGTQALVLDGGQADLLLVNAKREGDGANLLFALRTDQPSVRRQSIERLDGGLACALSLHDLPASEADLIGTPEQAQAIQLILAQHALAANCAETVGIMLALHAQTVDYLKVRRQFGRAIGSFQVLQHAAVDMLIATELSQSIVMAACMALDDGAADAALRLHQAKWIVSGHARTVRHSAVQLHGGMGMTDELEIGAYFKRLMVLEKTGGSPQQILRQAVAVG